MQLYIDAQTRTELSEREVKTRLSQPIQRTKTDLVPQPPLVEYDEAGEVISTTERDPQPVERNVTVTRTVGNVAAVTNAELADVDVLRIEYIETPPPVIEPWQTVAQGEIDKSAPGEWRTTWVINTPPLADIVDAKLAEIAAARWEFQNSGVTVAGTEIASDTDTALYIDTSLTKMAANPALVLTWKTQAGDFVTLDQPALTVVGDAIFAHVQGAFAAEASLMATIGSIADDETLTDAEKITEIWAVVWVDPVPAAA
ncbi:DUF4376 domain-containing protein [Gilvimarinus agarilyticus]|uniref:DUF4376 domain-containing protein n=1 Tax=Gilvimarinus agarilyticus TaxID=679259 RepID=UPI0005A0C8C8|nr:DUF4376 domain-containing protein [Gilvimarinus agarilyticus]